MWQGASQEKGGGERVGRVSGRKSAANLELRKKEGMENVKFVQQRGSKSCLVSSGI